MDELRLTLLIIGIVVIALVYLISRRRGREDTTTERDDSLQQDTEWMEEIARQRRMLAGEEPPPAVDDSAPSVPVLDDIIPEPASRSPQQPQTEHSSHVESSAEESPQEREPDREKSEPAPRKEQHPRPEPSPDEELIAVLHIMAPGNRMFIGADLFSALEEVGLRFGEGGIFHYYHSRWGEESNDAILFSVANVLEPGTFEGGQMEQEFTTPGVVMFMRAPGAVPARNMIETLLLKAQQLAQLLKGEMRDEARNPLTESTIEAMLTEASAFDNRTGNPRQA